MKSHLKVKVVTLASEMSYIRIQEEKWKNKARYARQKEAAEKVKYAEDNFWSLRHHRNGLKDEARHTHLAYGAIKGVPYSKMELICYGVLKGYGSSEPDWIKIGDMIGRFSKLEPNQSEILQRFAEWITDAQAWYQSNERRIPVFQADLAKERQRKFDDPELKQQKQRRAESWRKYNGVIDSITS